MSRAKARVKSPRKNSERPVNDETPVSATDEGHESTSSLTGNLSLSSKFDSTPFTPDYTVRRPSIEYIGSHEIYPLLEQLSDYQSEENLFIGLSTFFLGAAASGFTALVTAQTTVQSDVLTIFVVITFFVALVFGVLWWSRRQHTAQLKARILNTNVKKESARKRATKHR